jgi:outer membrane biosynthesis protein TonB
MKWTFKPAKMHDVPVQIETLLTFAFNSKVGNSIPILSDAEARKLATNVVEPKFPPGSAKGTEVKVQIGVSLDGSVNGVGNLYNVPTPLFMAAYSAVRQWHFRPYIRDSKPDLFGADIVFRVP